MARPTKRTKKRDDVFFNILSASGSVKKACELSGYSLSAVYRYRQEDAEFFTRWNASREAVIAILEDTLFDMAVNGEKDYKSVKFIDEDGEHLKLFEIRKRSFSAAMALLKVLEPEKYNDAVVLERFKETLLYRNQNADLSDEEIVAEIARLDKATSDTEKDINGKPVQIKKSLFE
ncbi:hypothetical protein [Xanthomarina gelatinilytica]|uniref:hypothetical protein n=1 Tax=Xanthomarina gelatinilytica TaxID=1137281 RepID=UPI003AA86D52